MEEEKEPEKKVETKEISLSKRNSALFHLGIPYFIGRNVSKIVIEVLGEVGRGSFEAGKKTKRTACSIGELIGEKGRFIEVVVKKHKQ